MKSKLFTPNLLYKGVKPLQAESPRWVFMNPPTHAEIPVNRAPTSERVRPLSLKGSGKGYTPSAPPHGVRAKRHIDY